MGGFAETGNATLDRIEVTGSRIDPADVFQAGERPATDLRPREQGSVQSPLARVRTRFADTAVWQAGIVLAPGNAFSLAQTARHFMRFNVAQAAEQLGLPRKTLYDKLVRHQLDSEQFR